MRLLHRFIATSLDFSLAIFVWWTIYWLEKKFEFYPYFIIWNINFNTVHPPICHIFMAKKLENIEFLGQIGEKQFVKCIKFSLNLQITSFANKFSLQINFDFFSEILYFWSRSIILKKRLIILKYGSRLYLSGWFDTIF